MKKRVNYKIQMILIISIIIFAMIGIKSNASTLIESKIREEVGEDIVQDLQINARSLKEEVKEKLQEENDSNDEKITKNIPEEESIDRMLIMMEEPLEKLGEAIESLDKVFLSDEFQAEVDRLKWSVIETISNPIFRASIIGLLGFILSVLGIKLVLVIITFIAKWRIYNKAGKPGWGLLLPVYKDVLLLEIADLSPALLLIYFTLFIPVFGPFIFIVAHIVIKIVTAIKLSKVFGQPSPFAIGLILLPTIFNSILGFGEDEYKKDKSEIKEKVVEEEKVKEKVVEAKIEDVKEEEKTEKPKKEVKEKTTKTKTNADKRETTKESKKTE